jgi:hypothetical protein
MIIFLLIYHFLQQTPRIHHIIMIQIITANGNRHANIILANVGCMATPLFLIKQSTENRIDELSVTNEIAYKNCFKLSSQDKLKLYVNVKI